MNLRDYFVKRREALLIEIRAIEAFLSNDKPMVSTDGLRERDRKPNRDSDGERTTDIA